MGMAKKIDAQGALHDEKGLYAEKGRTSAAGTVDLGRGGRLADSPDAEADAAAALASAFDVDPGDIDQGALALVRERMRAFEDTFPEVAEELAERGAEGEFAQA